MTITVNGESQSVDNALSVADLVKKETGSDTSEGIAVAINGAVVPASQWDRTINAGDTVDILSAVQGG